MAYKGLLNNEFIIKLIILFVLKNYNKPITNQVLTQITLEDVDIDYYLMQKCLFDIINIGWIRVFKEEGENKYEMNKEPVKSAEYFEKEIPYVIRQKLLFSVKKRLHAELPESKIESDIIVSENGEFNVYLKIYEKGDLLFELNINVGSRDLALRTKEHFLKNAMQIYMETTKNVMQDV
ncbi:MAG: DUF4364 family protein [Clostridia bacterium]|nr:DUF4364 family protein [Oscillospiraceae bacterium]MBR4892890.1 DUF4364 family protein [Clostridia bacterium]